MIRPLNDDDREIINRGFDALERARKESRESLDLVMERMSMVIHEQDDRTTADVRLRLHEDAVERFRHIKPETPDSLGDVLDPRCSAAVESWTLKHAVWLVVGVCLAAGVIAVFATIRGAF